MGGQDMRVLRRQHYQRLRFRRCLPTPRGQPLTPWPALSIHPPMGWGETYSEPQNKSEIKILTRRSFGVFLASGSFSKQLSTKRSACGGNRPSGVSLGAGSFTICCSSSRMLIVIPSPCKLTPLLFLLSFLDVFFRGRGGGRPRAMDPGRRGESVPSRSERSESSDDDSEKGKRPSANSMREIPRDQTSDLTVYCAP